MTDPGVSRERTALARGRTQLSVWAALLTLAHLLLGADDPGPATVVALGAVTLGLVGVAGWLGGTREGPRPFLLASLCAGLSVAGVFL